MRKQLRGFTLGATLMALILTMVTPGLASQVLKTIQVATGITVYVDDVKLEPKDANGNPVEVFIHNGSTYLPVRAVSEAVGKPITWDGKTQSVYIGKRDNAPPISTRLINLDNYMADSIYIVSNPTSDATKDNLGNMHTSVYYTYSNKGNAYITYKLNGAYSYLSGTFYQTYVQRSSNYTTHLSIYGDGELLYTDSVSGGIDPIPFKVDMTGVLEMKIVLNGTRENTTNNRIYAGIGEPTLYS